MSRKKVIVKVGILFSIILSGFILTKPTKVESVYDPIFRLKAITNSADETGIRPDLLFFLKQHCARIGIHIDIYTYEWAEFVGMLIQPELYDWDIFYVGIIEGEGDPDFSAVYSENGTLNAPGYNTSMDWDEELGTGRNEWYLQTGKYMWPPDSEERIQHYWEWEDYLMDKILPILPTFTPKSHYASWSNLQGYNFRDGLLTSWGNMSWSGLHTGQNSLNEIIVAGSDWQNLNPLFGGPGHILECLLDPVYMYDFELNVYPHLATEIIALNDTHIRMQIREGVKWHEDPDGIFTNEYVDVDDFYFTYFSVKELSNYIHYFSWIEDIRKVNQYTLDIFIDGNPSTPENEPFAPAFKLLQVDILPEHYLNQTQLFDGKTPDITHSSWTKYTTNAFGTGLFRLESHDEGVQTTLSVVPDCWYLDPLVDKSDMDFVNRFGDFSGGLDTLRFRVIPSQITELSEFELGKIDLVPIYGQLDLRDKYLQDSDFTVYSKFTYFLGYFGYNMRSSRAHIGSWKPCPNDPDMTIGLAVRKAISYALDREEMNEVLFAGENRISDYPIYDEMRMWCNPNIIRYNHDLERAREYLAKAGYYPEDAPRGLNPWEITGIVLISLFIMGVIIFAYIRTGKK